MIFAIVRTAFAALRRDRMALLLSFLLPIAFFMVFAMIFGGQRDSTPKITLLVVDEDKTKTSGELVQALQRESGLRVQTRAADKNGVRQPDYTAATAEAAVRAGNAPVAIVIPKGFGEQPISFGPAAGGTRIRLMSDASDAIAPQMVNGLLQKAVMSSMPETMAEQGMKFTGQGLGGLTPAQDKRMKENLDALHRSLAQRDADRAAGKSTDDSGNGGLIAVDTQAVVGDNKDLADRLAFLHNAVGAIQGPFDSFLALRGLKTLALRMERHCSNALKIARWLEGRKDVERVFYPGLESHPQHALAKAQMAAFGGIVTVVLKRDLAGTKRFLERCKLFTLAESLGGVESLIEHPAIMTHASIPEDQRKVLGISDALVRLSCGVEDADDLIADLERALA